MRRRKVWQVHPERLDLVGQVSSRHGLPRLIARLLLNRGLSDPEEVAFPTWKWRPTAWPGPCGSRSP